MGGVSRGVRRALISVLGMGVGNENACEDCVGNGFVLEPFSAVMPACIASKPKTL
jgi:hypothetical protein